MGGASLLVVGNGYVGSRVLALHRGDAAVGLSRSGGFDLDTAAALPVTPADRYRVLYTVPPSPDAATDLRLGSLLAMLQPLPAVFTYIGTTGVYGDCGGADVDEETPLNPTSARARRRADAERQLAQWADGKDVRLYILRVPGIYGPGRLGLERLAAGDAVLTEADAGPGNRIHVDDLVACCDAALAGTAPAGIYNVGDGDHRSSSWFRHEVARQAGLAAPPAVSRAQAEAQFGAIRMSFLSESRRIVTRRMREQLGVRPRFANAEDGIRASLQT